MLTIKWNDLAWNYLTIEQSDRYPLSQSYYMQSHRPSKGKERIFSESTKKNSALVCKFPACMFKDIIYNDWFPTHYFNIIEGRNPSNFYPLFY